MPRYGLIFVLLLSAVLAGCMATPEEQITQGIANARDAFENVPKEANETVGKMDLYLPKGYDIEEPSDDYNSMITKGNDSFILFINPNEKEASTFFYDLQKADPEQKNFTRQTMS